MPLLEVAPGALPATPGVLGPLGSHVRLLFFLGFFAGTALAYVVGDRYRLRQLCVATIIGCVLVVSIVGIHLPPVDHMQKFGSPSEQTESQTEIRIVDASGDELPLDVRATPPVGSLRAGSLGERMATRYSEAEQEEVARTILENAKEYRAYIESDPLVRADRLQFPRHGLDYRWDTETLAAYDEFVGIRIYDQTIHFSDDATEIEEIDEEQIFEWMANEGASESAAVEGCLSCS